MQHVAHLLSSWMVTQTPDGGGAGGALAPFLTIGLMFAVVYFLMIRPQSKQQKEHQSFLTTLQKGQEVATYGGILGKVHSVGEDTVTIEVAKDVRIQVVKSYVYAQAQKAAPAAASASKEADKGDGKAAEAKK